MFEIIIIEIAILKFYSMASPRCILVVFGFCRSWVRIHWPYNEGDPLVYGPFDEGDNMYAKLFPLKSIRDEKSKNG